MLLLRLEEFSRVGVVTSRETEISIFLGFGGCNRTLCVLMCELDRERETERQRDREIERERERARDY